jgi:hypothetical protein
MRRGIATLASGCALRAMGLERGGAPFVSERGVVVPGCVALQVS